MDWPLVNTVISHVLRGVPLVAAAAVVLAAGRFVFLRTLPFDSNKELIFRQNKAYGIVFAAYLLGAALAVTGTFFGSRQDPVWSAAAAMLGQGALAIVLLRASIWVNDRFILSGFSIVKEIRDDQNLGVGFCVAGSCVACGLILNGALTGYSANFVLGLRDIVCFWIAGQAVLVVASISYRKMARYDVHRLIEYDDNVAVGVAFGGYLAGLGIIVRAALVGSGTETLGRELAITALLAVSGSALLLVFHSQILRFIVPNTKSGEEVEMHGNVAMSAVTACVTLAIALFLGSILHR